MAPGGAKKLYYHEGLGGAIGALAGVHLSGGSWKESMYAAGAAALGIIGFQQYYLAQKTDKAVGTGGIWVRKFYVATTGQGESAVTGQDGVLFKVMVPSLSSVKLPAGSSTNNNAHVILYSGAAKESSEKPQGFQDVTSDVAFGALTYLVVAYLTKQNMREMLSGTLGTVIGGQTGSIFVNNVTK